MTPSTRRPRGPPVSRARLAEKSVAVNVFVVTTLEFKNLSSEPQGFSAALGALWCDAHGEWDRAHQLVQDDESREAAWVHAYLHRKEGDAGNARYWYARARREFFSGSLEEEWTHLASALLEKDTAA